MSTGRSTLGWIGTGYGFPTTGQRTSGTADLTPGQDTTTTALSGYEANTTRRRSRALSPYNRRPPDRDTTRPLEYSVDYSYLSHDYYSELPGENSVSFADEPVSWRSERRAHGVGTARSGTLDYLYDNSRRFDGVDYTDDGARRVGGFSSDYHTSRRHEDYEYSYATGGRTDDADYSYGSSSRRRYGTRSGTGGGGYYSSGARRSRELYGDEGETYGDSGTYGADTYGTDTYGADTYGADTYGSGTYGGSSSRRHRSHRY